MVSIRDCIGKRLNYRELIGPHAQTGALYDDENDE